MREVKKKFLYTEARTSFPFLSFVPLYHSLSFFFAFASFLLSSTRNSPGNRVHISRTHLSRTCVCHALSYGRACLSDAHACSCIALVSRCILRGCFIDETHDREFRTKHATSDERAPFLSDRSRVFPALLFLVENIARFFPCFFPPFSSLLVPDENEISRRDIHIFSLRVAEAPLGAHTERAWPLFPVKWRRFLCKYPVCICTTLKAFFCYRHFDVAYSCILLPVNYNRRYRQYIVCSNSTQ